MLASAAESGNELAYLAGVLSVDVGLIAGCLIAGCVLFLWPNRK